MTRLSMVPRALLLLLAVLLALATGCKQGEGEVCQIDTDCEEDLICNPGTQLCQRPGGGGSDAAVSDARISDAASPDGAPFDAAPADAEVADAAAAAD